MEQASTTIGGVLEAAPNLQPAQRVCALIALKRRETDKALKILRNLPTDNQSTLELLGQVYHARGNTTRGDWYLGRAAMISVELDRDGDKITTAADEIRKLLAGEDLDKALLVAT